MGNQRFPINRLISSASILQIFVSVSRHTCTPQIMIQANTFSTQIYQCVLNSCALFISWTHSNHYGDVIMSTMTSQITSPSIVYWTVYSGADEKASKLRVTVLCEGNSLVTGEFPTQRSSNAEKCFHLMTSSWHQCEAAFNESAALYNETNQSSSPTI